MQAMTGAIPGDLILPGPNPFIPKELEVTKFDVASVSSAIDFVTTRAISLHLALTPSRAPPKHTPF